MEGDDKGDHLRNLFSLKNAIAVQTSNGNWIRDFYLPEMVCTESVGQLILFQSKSTDDSYIHYNENQFKLAGRSTVLFKNVNAKWNPVDVDIGSLFT